VKPHNWVFDHVGINYEKEPVNWFKCSQCGFELWHSLNASDFEIKISTILAFTLIDSVSKLANHPNILGSTKEKGLHAVIAEDCDAYVASLSLAVVVDVIES
jgi:hypothetical protein